MTRQEERDIRRDFRRFRGVREKFNVVEEHDAYWVCEPETGGQWAVVESIAGYMFEQVSEPY